MKHVYLWSIVGLAFIVAFFPQSSSAQCTCSGGVPATPVSYGATVAMTKASSLNFVLPQFDPSIGTLTCIRMRDTLSCTTTSFALNSGPDSAAFQFLLTLFSKVNGPGFNTSHTFTRTYPYVNGYDTLAPYGMPGYTRTYGPDVISSNFPGTASFGGNPAYLGTGTVTLTYSISGGLIVADGPANDTTGITTTIGGKIWLTYYWCPATPLASLINNFSAIKRDKFIELQWLAANDQTNVNYEIEYSKDGNEYLPVGNVPSATHAAGTVTQYQYQYFPSAADVGELYFRIKRIDADGNILYSMIKVVDMSAMARIGIQTYPNPVVNTITVQFDQNQNGNYLLELVNTTGQIMQQRSIVMSGTSVTKFDIAGHLPKGVYFLRAKDIKGDKQYVTKVLVQ
ncbi:MAG TPA: choice-of-anchor E domain-containing protein [Puia sp.]|nr:choice-of-anchor E domain-containing protein [Puia sp.]